MSKSVVLTNESGESLYPVTTTDSVYGENGTKTLNDILRDKQPNITETNKLSSNLISDTDSANMFMTQAEKTKLSGIEDGANKVTKTSQLTNDSGFMTGYTETDPTVPSWAKQSTKPTYTASEVGALPSSTVIPSKTSQLTNDSGFLTSAPVTSVNGMTGAVTGLAKTSDLANYFPLSGGAIGANGIQWGDVSLPQDTAPQFICTIDAFAAGGRQKWASVADLKTQLGVPTKTSQLTNDSGYLTSAPVTSVNGKTGAVTGLATINDLANYAPATQAKFVYTYKTVTNISSGTSISLTDILPDTSTKYIILIAFNGWGTSTQWDAPLVSVTSSVLTNAMYICGGRNFTATGDQIVGSTIVPVGTDRKITISYSGAGSSNRLSVYGYWRYI